MPYEDDYKMWLEKMLIESNPDWVCDGMCDAELTHEWCGKHCGEGSDYVTPKCLHMFYHHITRADRKTENSSEKPNNCEHITEDGVTCAKYPACDDCLHNPLNKVKGSERLVKGSDEAQTEPERNMAEDIVESFGFKAESYRQAKAKTESQTERKDNADHIE